MLPKSNLLNEWIIGAAYRGKDKVLPLEQEWLKIIFVIEIHIVGMSDDLQKLCPWRFSHVPGSLTW